MCLVKRLFIAALTISDIPKSRVPQLACIWMSLPGASGLGNLTKNNHNHIFLTRDDNNLPILGLGLVQGDDGGG